MEQGCCRPQWITNYLNKVRRGPTGPVGPAGPAGPPGDAELYLVTVNNDHTVLLTDEVVLVDATNNDVVITLPNIATAFNTMTKLTRKFNIKRIDDSAFTVTVIGDADIEKEASINLSYLGNITIVADGVEWYIL